MCVYIRGWGWVIEFNIDFGYRGLDFFGFCFGFAFYGIRYVVDFER